MNQVKEKMTMISQWLRSFTELGLALIMAFIVIDILFPGTTGVVNNLGIIVAQFSKQGLVGLIALLLFLLVFKNK